MRNLDIAESEIVSGGFFFMPFIWGSVLGAIAYSVNHKHDFNPEACAIAATGGAVTAAFGPFGVVGKVFQVVNVVNTAETVNYVQNRES